MFEVVHVSVVVVGNAVETKVKMPVVTGELKDTGIEVRTVILLHRVLDSDISTCNACHI